METVSAFKGDLPGGSMKRTWQGKSRFDCREQCVDDRWRLIRTWQSCAEVGLAKMFDGHAEETEREENEALQLSPRDPRA
jgi:hypothetical protein